ncbi:MAG: GNAT family N-acetyltransferase [Bacteroidetes bacterium]|nr:GNAT family N-acetyltransferase [Bacteroidota bacterium]
MASCGLQYWPIVLLTTGEHICCSGLRPYNASEGIHEFGVHIRAGHWGKGYPLEGGQAVRQHAFTTPGAGEVTAGHNTANTKSQRMLAGQGFRYTHHAFHEPGGQYHPTYPISALEYRTETGC